MTDFTWLIGGEAGFGIMTTGVVFSKIATRSGYHIFDYVEYPSLIRGGHNAYEVHISEAPVSYLSPTIDILVCLNKETYEKHKTRLTSSSLVVFDQDAIQGLPLCCLGTHLSRYGSGDRNHGSAGGQSSAGRLPGS